VRKYGMQKHGGTIESTHRRHSKMDAQGQGIRMPVLSCFLSTVKSTYEKHDGKHVRGTSTTGTDTGMAALPIKTTDILAHAQQLRFVPCVYTTDYSPIMRAAQESAVKF